MAYETYERVRRLAQVASLPHLRLPLFLLCFSAAYFVAARVGIATSMPPEGIVILWPPNAIVLVTLLSVSRDKWWLFFLVTVATEIAADVPDYPLWAAAGYGIVNFSEAAIAAFLLSTLTGSGRLVGMRDFVRFLAVGPFLASGTAALFGAAIYKVGAPELDYLHYWRVFWLGDALGLLIIGTTLLAWKRPRGFLRPAGPLQYGEAALLAAGLLSALLWTFLEDAELPRVYLIFPFLAWAALRFGVRGASAAVAATTAIAIGATIMDQGPFVALSHIDSVVGLQGLIAVVALSTFVFAFSAEDAQRMTSRLRQSVADHEATEGKLRATYRELERANRELDQIVAERTRELEETIARNEMLLKEVHHRVKNNLQLVSSLLSLHSRSATNLGLQGKFAEVQGQVSAIGATYDVLQQLESVDVVDYGRIVPTLCRNIAGASGDVVPLKVEVGGKGWVSADTAVALSLALNELITNSIKHMAFEEAAAIAVACRREGADVLLTVADNGPGFPPDFDPEQAQGFGMRMVRSLVRQAGGTLHLARSERGAVVELRVPAAGGP